MDINSGLIISCGGEDLALLGGDGGIPFNQSGGYSAHSLNGQGQRSYIQKQDISRTGITGQLTALDSSADSYTLVRIQALAGSLPVSCFTFS